MDPKRWTLKDVCNFNNNAYGYHLSGLSMRAA